MSLGMSPFLNLETKQANSMEDTREFPEVIFDMRLLSYNTDGKAGDEQWKKDMKMDDERERAIVSLRAIKDVLQYNLFDVKIPLVAEYHSALDKLEKTGIDVSDFRIPDSWIQGHDIPSIYSALFGPRVRRELFLIKLDAILQYLA